MRKQILFILLPFLLTGMAVKSQDSLSIAPFSLIVPNDTLVNGNTDSISFYVINNALTTFTGGLSVNFAVLDSFPFFTNNLVDSTYYPGLTIPPGDSALLGTYINYTVGPTLFKYDINVIVIWPMTANPVSIDSAYYTVVILHNADLIPERLITAYPNPFDSRIYIDNQSQNPIEEVRIYDSMGRLAHSGRSELLYTDSWSPGIYLMRVTLSDKQTLVLRIVKQ